jgi:hypothetical protein
VIGTKYFDILWEKTMEKAFIEEIKNDEKKGRTND